jgi:RHS repeat-associated protein
VPVTVTSATSTLPTVRIAVVAQEIVYRTETALGVSGPMVTNTSYTWLGTTAAMASRTTASPAALTTQNGSGIAEAATEVFDAYGRVIWTRDQNNYLTYRSYDPATGAVVKSISDVDVSKTADFANLPSGWTTPAGVSVHQITQYEVDDLGRVTKLTDPAGAINYTVYKDASYEVRSYSGWGATVANAPTGPTKVMRRDLARNYTERLSITTTPAISGGRPTGNEAFVTGDIQALERDIFDDNDRLQYQDRYLTMSGTSYVTTTATLGTKDTNYERTVLGNDGAFVGYDLRGRRIRSVDASGTITKVTYDAMNRLGDTFVGTIDASVVKISSNIYDLGLVGNGTVTSSIAYASGTVSYTTTNTYDYRNRLITTLGPDSVLTNITLDNLGRATQTETYANGSITPTANLRSRVQLDYDERGQVYRSTSWQVDPVYGIVGNNLVTNRWYNARGLMAKEASPSGLFSKVSYDGLGRVTSSWRSTDSAETLYADAQTRTNDTVIDGSSTIYNMINQPICVTTFQRKDNDASSTGDLTTTNAVYTVGISWYDLAHRAIGSANYGRDNGSTRYVYATNGSLIGTNGIPTEASNAPRTPSATNTDILVTCVKYDTAGRLYQVIDPKNRTNETAYNLAGRAISVIENRVDGVVHIGDFEVDRTTTTNYLPGGRVSSVTALVPNGTSIVSQVTKYLYGSTLSASLQTNIIYPDSTDTDGSGTNQVKLSYDYLGRKVTTTDQRGVIHTYAYDTQGRRLSDAATTIPATVDSTVKRIEWTYDDVSRMKSVSSYDSAAAGAVLDQVAYTYSNYGQITKSEQSHSGAVVSGTTPAVTYTYADGASGSVARYVRLASVTYPTASRTMYLRYPTSGIGDALNRPYQVAGDAVGTTVYGDYTYLGANNIVKLTQPFASAMTLDFGAGGTYSNLDRFMRPTAHRWMIGSSVIAGMDYAYDNSHARTRQKVAWAGAPANFDEAATYDGLDRVKKINRGALASVTSDIADAASVWQQQWGLDAVGNWRTWTQDADGGVGAGVATVQTRATNKANEIDVDDDHANAPGASITGTGVTWIAPVYDAGGNMTSAPTVADGTVRQHYRWDAWNRLVSVSTDNAGVPGQVLVQYRYDGLGHRIRTTDTKNTVATTDDVTDDIYYNEANQEIEVRRAGSATACEQYIWDLRYIDTALVRFRSPTNNGTLSETIVPLADANHNVTALVNTSGTVLERYRYCPYGKRIITDAAGTVITASVYDWRIGFTGRRHDVETGLAFYRNRYYHATLGIFISRDPLGYVDGMNFYQYVRGNPWSLLDALGLSPDGSFERKIFNQSRMSCTTCHQFVAYGNWGDANEWERAQIYAASTTPIPTMPTRLGAAFRLAGSSATFGASASVLLAGGVSEGATLGGSTPVSVPMMAVGVYGVAASLDEMYASLTTLITGDPYESEMERAINSLPKEYRPYARGAAMAPLIPLGGVRSGSPLINCEKAAVNREIAQGPLVNPSEINFSQRTVSSNNYAETMGNGAWDWSRSGPLRVMERDGGWVSYDNRRLLAAQQSGLSAVPIQIVQPGGMMKPGLTWEQAFLNRFTDPRNISAGGVVPNGGLAIPPTVIRR